MAERDKVIKSGQITLPRILFLAAVGGIIVATVALGGVWLRIGYWVLTFGFCVLLYLVSSDYGVKLEKVEPTPAQPAPGLDAATATEGTRAAAAEVRPRRRSNRPAKRRR